MTQMASLLAVATVFVCLWTLNIQSEERGGLIRETKYLCRNLNQKCRGGVLAGFYGIKHLPGYT
jgi:hypothetical protein